MDLNILTRCTFPNINSLASPEASGSKFVRQWGLDLLFRLASPEASGAKCDVSVKQSKNAFV